MDVFHQSKQGIFMFFSQSSTLMYAGSDLLLNPIFLHGFAASSHLVLLLFLSMSWACKRFRKISGHDDSKQEWKNTRVLYYKPTIFCCWALSLFYLLLCVLNYFYWYRSGWSNEKLVIQLDLVLRTLAWIAISAFLHIHFPHSCELKFPILLRIWWGFYFFTSSCCLVVDLALHVKHQFLPIHLWVFDAVSILAGLFFCFIGLFGNKGEDTLLEEPLLDSSTGRSNCVEFNKVNGGGNVTPFSNANFLSILTFSWIGPLITAGNKKALDLEDVPQLAAGDSVYGVFPVLINKLESVSNSSSSSSDGGEVNTLKLVKALIFSAWREIILTALLCLIYTCASYVGPALIDTFVHYLNGRREFKNEGFILVSTFFVAKLIECFSQRHWFFRLQQVGIRARAALVAMIYKKGLTLSSQSRQGHSIGEIINFMSVDAERIGDFGWFMHDLWLVPLQVALALLILYKNLGLASIATFVATLIVMLANVPLGKLQEKFQGKLMESKDGRMKATSEILRNMRILKLQGWEMKFLSKIIELRKNEAGWLRKYVYTSAITTSVFWTAPTFVSVVTFGACMVMKIPLESGKILSALATFRILQEPIYTLPDTISMIAQTKVSLDRIASFLRLDDLQPDVLERLPMGSSELAVEIIGGNFSWDLSSPNPTLKDLNFRVCHGMKVAVCGTVGSGKSSLLSCILGEMPKVSGTLKLCGTKAYVAQSPWIQSGKIEENILFGKEMDRERYKRVLEACSLKKDLEILSFGDQTVIGERGINLSGGQKQRIQIARALFQDADIFLFDDPFSAVDAHTGTHLFKVMKDGRITQAGKYNDILSSGTDFMELVGAHNKALSDLDSVEAGPPPSENLINIEEDIDVGMAKEAMCKEEEKRDDQNGQMNEVVEPKGQLVQEEEREKGRVGFPVYWKYITAAYRGTLVPFILLAQILFQLLQIGSNYWMAWATPVSKDARPAVEGSPLIFVYVTLALGSAVCVLVRAMLLASTDQSAVDMNIPLQVGQFAFTIIQLLGIIAVMSQVAWQVFIIFIPVIATCVWYQQYYIPSARELSRLVGVCKAPVIQHFAESISGSTTIRSFDQESRFWDVNMKLIDGYSRPKFHTAGAMEWLCFRLAMLSSITFAFSLIFLISIPDGVIDPGIAGLAVTYGLNLNTLQARVIRTLCNLENRIISVERILQYMSIPSEPPLVVEENKPRHDWPSHGEVDIQDLQVRYAPHMPFVLRGLTCTFSGGMKTGIVGRTGSGKSTLIQTLFRIVEPTVGQILIDGINISTIGLHDLRSRLSIIPQDPTMFEGNVRSNLDPLEEYTDEQIWEALDRCQLGEEVRKKEGKLDATVTENGENWSMGQRQLVCLGRVLLKKSKVLVLDEATASVDTATDNLIQQTLKQHFADCTVVTIAHRITSVLDSDMVILLDHGLVVEYDSPKKLLENKSSSFAKLVAEYTQCFHDELSALLQLKTGFSASDPLLPSWKLATNCCSWEGVSCHNATSHVIGLDLSSYRLSGYLNSSSLRRLRFLRTLNLADNDFGPSPIPSSLDGVVNLTHLNLSHSGFSGQVPLGISRLTKLVSLDLSTYDSSLKLENPNLRILIQNLSSLRELILDGVNISAHGRDWCNAVSSALPNLRVLSLSRCYLSGAVHDSLLQLRFLSELRLNENNLSSVVPDFLANFSSLTSLELGSCQLHGELPKEILLLPTPQRLNLRDNSLLTGSLPEFRENSALKVLLLAFTSFFGELPDSIGNLKFLTELDLSSCNFYGPIPSSLANLTQLVLLDLSSNRFDNWMPLLPPSKRITTETLSTAQISSTYHDQLLPNLRYLYLLNNSLSATVHSSLFVLPSLKRLLLNQNQLTGILNEFENASSSLLKTVDLSNNKLEGHNLLPLGDQQSPNLRLRSTMVDDAMNQNQSLMSLAEVDPVDIAYEAFPTL
ncbi:hypothetical protein HHK36_032950 [Tetracentron sinense]|uniref:Uncharacterized protein n=1 Tax=Tetracentron sinense TaxID=13715 RepID=A0A834Y9G0_TETSI|nr:hypothetical protein HHK36_032950 [Tetracentron sinense]